MIKNNNWFTILEIIVATSILTISVFWVYKLISENNKIINNSNIYLNTTILIPSIENCIKNIEPGLGTKYYFDFWTNYQECNISNTPTINIIDNIEYTMSAEWTNTAIWKLRKISIYSDNTWEIKSNFVQK